MMARRRRSPSSMSPMAAAVICLLATHLCAATATHPRSLRALESPESTGSTGTDGSSGSAGVVAGAIPSTATPGRASSRSRNRITGRHVPHTTSSSSSSSTVYRPLGVLESGCGTATCDEEPWRCNVMSDPIKVYLIWHGAFSHAQKEVVRTFVRSLSSSEGTVAGWWDISELYDDCNGNTVSASVSLGGEMQVRPNAMRLLLGERSIVNLVRMGINRGKFPADKNGVYFVIGNRYSKQWSSLNPWGDNFCSGFCGWHSYRTIKGKQLKYAFVGNPAGRCMWSCGGKTLYNAAAGPSGVGKGMDSVVSTLAHELTESATDPYLATWSDADGYENADVCDIDFTSSDLSTTSDGAPYNLVGIGGSKFLVQKNYHPTQHECVNTV
ncbi:unnamed protein product [Closterium sp. Yama58-4]|nr:unnamed protein product [Closterium sp. Yama58-4]